LYSKNINNLMLAGRNISVSHMAFGSTRDMATTSVVGQAVGTACAIAIRENILPRAINNYITELQQTLIKDDCYIPNFKSEDPDDLARNANIRCSSENGDSLGRNIINGIPRNTLKAGCGGRVEEKPLSEDVLGNVIQNGWVSNVIGDSHEWIAIDFDKTIKPKELRIKFDSNLSKEITPSIERRVLRKQIPGIPKQLVRDYEIEFYKGEDLICTERIENNYQRFNIHKVTSEIECDSIKLKILATHGDEHARVFEVRVY